MIRARTMRFGDAFNSDKVDTRRSPSQPTESPAGHPLSVVGEDPRVRAGASGELLQERRGHSSTPRASLDDEPQRPPYRVHSTAPARRTPSPDTEQSTALARRLRPRGPQSTNGNSPKTDGLAAIIRSARARARMHCFARGGKMKAHGAATTRQLCGPRTAVRTDCNYTVLRTKASGTTGAVRSSSSAVRKCSLACASLSCFCSTRPISSHAAWSLASMRSAAAR